MRTGSATALDLAGLADMEIVQEVVRLGSKVTALTCHMAIQHDNAAMLDKLFFNLSTFQLVIVEFYGCPLVCLAACLGKSELVNLMLAYGADMLSMMVCQLHRSPSG